MAGDCTPSPWVDPADVRPRGGGSRLTTLHVRQDCEPRMAWLDLNPMGSAMALVTQADWFSFRSVSSVLCFTLWVVAGFGNSAPSPALPGRRQRRGEIGPSGACRENRPPVSCLSLCPTDA